MCLMSLKTLQLNGIFNKINFKQKSRFYIGIFYFCKAMKKKLVLFILFVLPIVAYLFFASGVNSFGKLPIITPSVKELNSLGENNTKLFGKITLLGFTGTDFLQKKGKCFNLYEEIYKKNKAFKDFQIVYIVPAGYENQIAQLKTELTQLGAIDTWKFVFADKDKIDAFYKSFKLKGNLNQDTGSNYVFIIDKDRNLRGRKGKSPKGDEEYREGYNTTKVAELHNEMTDDVKIILAEYRLALKKNNANRKKYGL